MKKIVLLMSLILFKFYTVGGMIEQGIIEKSFIERFLPENPVIVECGAYTGKDTIEMALLWPHAEIHAFEAAYSIFDDLKKETGFLKNVSCYLYALSDKTGTAQFYISHGASYASSSLLKPREHIRDHPDVFFDDVITVPTITLDDWAKLHNIHRVDFLWLDMQGAEYLMLAASPAILSTVSVIYAEVSLNQSYESTPLYPEFRTWLEKLGFRVVREELPWKDMGNVLFVRQ